MTLKFIFYATLVTLVNYGIGVFLTNDIHILMWSTTAKVIFLIVEILWLRAVIENL
jgi:hypothetical protein